MKLRGCLSFSLLILVEASAHAQLLPRGIGAVQGGYRKFDDNAQYFDGQGSLRPASDKFNTDFTSSSMASGDAGADMKRLYEEVKKFESPGATSGVAEDLNFGEMRAEVQTDIQAKFVGFAYGLSDKLTVFAGLPFVQARVDTKISYNGANNNAALIKKRLGNMIYKELQSGLDEAANMSADSIRANIEDTKGYGPVDQWEYDGVGDLVLGGRTEVPGSRFGMSRFSLGLSSQLDIATGHQDDPDILIDLPIGRGYHAVSFGSEAKYAIHGFEAALLGSMTQGISRDVSKRVPNEEGELPDASRKAKVHWQPGQDLGAGVKGGYGTSLVRGTYTVGTSRHLRDRFTGSLEGDYSVLERATETSKQYHEVSVVLSTVNAYSKKKFAVPFIMTLTAHDTLGGSNTAKVRYIELSVTSFFATPMAKEAPSQRVKNERSRSSSVASK